MLLEILIAIAVGSGIGIVTGLTPGIHLNMMAVLLLAAAPSLSSVFNTLQIAIIILSAGVVQCFLDPIPCIFLGAPESEMALGVLPGHRYLLRGLGLMALKLTIIGCFGAVILSILFFYPLIFVVKYAYPIIEKYMAFILIIIAVFMILRDHKKLWALLVFLMSGILGMIVLNLPSTKDPLLPLFSGLFGISTLLVSLNDNTRIPKQQIRQDIKLDKKITIKALLSGCFSGFITATLPGIGAGIAAVISVMITRNLKDHGFMILIGSINTYNFCLSLVTYYVLNKARNGAIISVQKLIGVITVSHVLIFCCAVLIAGAMGVFLSMKLGKAFSSLVSKVNYQKLVMFIIILITVVVIILSRWLGLLILIVSTAVGLIPAVKKVTRIQAMGCLIVPCIFWFLL